MSKCFYYSWVLTVLLLIFISSTAMQRSWAQSNLQDKALELSLKNIILVQGEELSENNKQSIPETIYVSNVTNAKPLAENEPQLVLKAIEGWGSLKLGLTFDEINTVLSNEYGWIALRESQNDTPGGYFLESYKNDYFNKVQFQFDQNQVLYLLRLDLNSRFFSFIQLYNNLVEKYGPPQENSYVRVVWRDNQRFMELYRNNVLVYVDKSDWQERLPESQIEDRRRELLNSVFDSL